MKTLKDKILEKLNVNNINIKPLISKFESFGKGQFITFNSKALNDKVVSPFTEKELKQIYDKFIPKNSMVYTIKDKDANFDLLGQEKITKTCQDTIYCSDDKNSSKNQIQIFSGQFLNTKYYLVDHIYYLNHSLYNDLYFYEP